MSELPGAGPEAELPAALAAFDSIETAELVTLPEQPVVLPPGPPPVPAVAAATGRPAPSPAYSPAEGPPSSAAPMPAQVAGLAGPARPAGRPFFAHPSEAEFARILDFYAVRWEYEPQVFPILWDLEGNVLESFAPDFYLPDMDLFVEMTTLRQSLVRKKNRKVRRLRELYPSINIKLLYARDFRALLFKYGRTALAGELSGTIERLVAEHDAEEGGALAAAREGADPGTGRTARNERDARPPRDADARTATIARSRAARRRAARRAAASNPSTPAT